MKEMRRNVMVGLFVLVGMGALAVLIILFGQGPTRFLHGKTYPIHVLFESVSGVREGTEVRLFGKTIGRVDQIDFRDPQRFTAGVRVTVAIDLDYRLPKGCRAETVEAGFLTGGRPPIQIIPGVPEAGFLEPDAYITGETRGAVETVIPPTVVSTFDKSATQIGEAAEALTPVLRDLHEVLMPRLPADVDRPGGLPGNLASALSRLDGSLKHFNAVLGDPEVQSQLKATIANLHTMSADGKVALSDVRTAAADAREAIAGAKTVMSNAQTTLERLDEHADHITRSTVDNLERAGRVFDNLSAATAAVAGGQGTLGKLVMDDRLYETLVLTARRLAETTEEFRVLVKDWQAGKIKVGF